MHFLIIPHDRKTVHPKKVCGLAVLLVSVRLRSDLDFCAVGKYKSDFAVPVDDGFFNHHRPDGVVPVVHYLRLFFEGADIKCHLLVLLAVGGA